MSDLSYRLTALALAAQQIVCGGILMASSSVVGLISLILGGFMLGFWLALAANDKLNTARAFLIESQRAYIDQLEERLKPVYSKRWQTLANAVQ